MANRDQTFPRKQKSSIISLESFNDLMITYITNNNCTSQYNYQLQVSQ